MNVKELAQAAIDAIKLTPKAQVFASRRGLCAGVNSLLKKRTVAFRRVDGTVQMEIWPSQSGAGSCPIQRIALSPDLEQQASDMLDAL